MEITNLNHDTPQSPVFSIPLIVITIVLATTAGFWLSRFFPTQKGQSLPENQKITASVENVTDKSSLKVGIVYGKPEKNFKDTATGIIEKGSINGEGTHILIRDGGPSQRASLTSSVVDLDLFVDKKVEVKGETNASNKTSWLLDIGVIKILE